jgi:hypothetical protein
MAGQFDVHLISNNIGALSNDFRPMFKIPASGGGISFLSCHVTGEGAGTSWLQLVDLGTAGTSVSSILATSGTAVSVAGIPQELTISTAFVDAGHWVGLKEANIGTTNAITIVSASYVMGKSGT